MDITPISKITTLNGKLPQKPLTINGCCDKVDITVGTTTIMFGMHRFDIRIDHCKTCGSVKATSYIKEK